MIVSGILSSMIWICSLNRFQICFRKDLFDDDITPLLKFVICNGNATVYQWKTGEAPTKIIKKETVEAVNLEAMAALASSPSELVVRFISNFYRDQMKFHIIRWIFKIKGWFFISYQIIIRFQSMYDQVINIERHLINVQVYGKKIK